MTPESLKLAADFDTWIRANLRPRVLPMDLMTLAKFADAAISEAVAAEREAIAKMVEGTTCCSLIDEIAARIRKREQKDA